MGDRIGWWRWRLRRACFRGALVALALVGAADGGMRSAVACDRQPAAGVSGARVAMPSLGSTRSLGSAQVLDSARALDSLVVVDGGVDIGDTILSDIVAVGADALRLFSRPARFDRVDWAVAGGALALGFGVMPLDDEIRERWLDARGVDGTRVADVANTFGTWTPAIAISGTLYLTGLAADWPAVRLAGRHVAQSVIYAGLITTAVKVAAGRQRPLYGEGPFVYDPFTSDDRFHSLASGHATLVFAIASSLSADIDHPAATIALYGAATLTGLSRMYADRHWASDVLLGAAVGTACGYGVVNLHREGDEQSSLMVVPSLDRLTLVWTF